MAFFEALNFSSSNEDGATEIAALAASRRILCLTGTGTRALDLLVGDADAVVALDANPVQNAALELKIAAIETCDHGAYLAFLGIAPSRDRLASYGRLRQRLSPAARDYWDRNRGAVAAGIWTAGRWEKLLRWNARALALFRGGAVEALMSAPTIELQAAQWQANFARGRLRAAIETIGRDWVWRVVMREPASAFLPGPREVSNRIANDFAAASANFLFRESDIATLVFRGRHRADGALPVHLHHENYARVRERLSRLRMVVGSLADLGRLDEGRFDGFSLSDFGSYCSAEGYAACWQAVIASAAPGAQYCERIFMNDMPVPVPDVTIDDALSDSLCASDRSIIYRIRTGVIGGPC